MEEDLKSIKEIKSTPPINIWSEIKNLASCGGGAGHMCSDRYTNHWGFYHITYKEKEKGYKMSDKYKGSW